MKDLKYDSIFVLRPLQFFGATRSGLIKTDKKLKSYILF